MIVKYNKLSMKKIKTLGLLFIVALAPLVFSNCDKEDEESCVAEEICSQLVTSCCSSSACVYKFNGKDYDAETEQDELADDLGCGSNARIAGDGNEVVKAQLQDLLLRAKAGLK